MRLTVADATGCRCAWVLEAQLPEVGYQAGMQNHIHHRLISQYRNVRFAKQMRKALAVSVDTATATAAAIVATAVLQQLYNCMQ
jgi:3-hydroxyisobutyrate dehydrogenase-like beta-hydroxyacid dehydrogenase